MSTNKLIHFYFDWNIFKYIKNPRNETDALFTKFIYSIKDYILIAYSPSHISGLLKNFDKTKWNYIIKDCEIITELTNNLCIYHDKNNQVHIEYRAPVELFMDQLDSTEFESLLDADILYQMMKSEQREQFESNFFVVKESIKSNSNNDPFSLIFQNSENPKEAFKNLLIHNHKIKNDPQTYIDLRSSLKDSIQKIKELPASDQEKFKEFLNNKGINKDINDLNEDDFIELTKEFVEGALDSTVSNKYMFKDIFGITKPEEINKKNTFKNIIDDSLHLEMAQYALYYITEDKANIEKSKLVSQEIGSINEIFTIEEANKFIRISLFSLRNNFDDNQKNST